MGQRTRKENMFNQGEAALVAIERDGKGGFYLCPLCLRAFCRNHGLADELEEEHAPQKMLGSIGEARCLTCQSCNHRAGDDVERRTAPRVAIRSAQHTCDRFGQFVRTDQGFLVPDPHRSGSVQGMELVLDQLELPMNVSRDERLVELRSALLVAFVTLGYTYIVGSGPELVRMVLDGAMDVPERTCIRIPRKASLELTEKSVLVVNHPLPAVFVLHPSVHCTSGIHAIVLPPAEYDGDFYHDVGELPRSSLIGVREEYEWPRPRQMPMHWDKCADPSHPRVRSCFGVDGERHHGWSHLRNSTEADVA